MIIQRPFVTELHIRRCGTLQLMIDRDIAFGSSLEDLDTAINNTKDEKGEIRTIIVTANKACYCLHTGSRSKEVYRKCTQIIKQDCIKRHICMGYRSEGGNG